MHLVAGIGSVWAENSRPTAALAAVPSGAPRLVLMHNPESYRQIRAGEAPLALAAHTHGGQIRVLGPRASWLDIVRQGEVVIHGWAADSIGAPGNRLYVNRGIGFSSVPVRINCRPELTLVTLRQAEGRLPEREREGLLLGEFEEVGLDLTAPEPTPEFELDQSAGSGRPPRVNDPER